MSASALVYAAARAPEVGEDYGALAATFPTDPTLPSIGSIVSAPLGDLPGSLDMVDANEGWAGGTLGAMLHYQNGTWTHGGGFATYAEARRTLDVFCNEVKPALEGASAT